MSSYGGKNAKFFVSDGSGSFVEDTTTKEGWRRKSELF